MDSLILFTAINKLAKGYNPLNINEWGEKHTYGQQADQVAQKLTEMGYCIQKGIPLNDDELKSESVDDNGE